MKCLLWIPASEAVFPPFPSFIIQSLLPLRLSTAVCACNNECVSGWVNCFPPSSLQAFQKLQDYTLLPTACSEASKLGASLSSLCLLINRKHTYFWTHTSNHQYVTPRLPAHVHGGAKGPQHRFPQIKILVYLLLGGENPDTQHLYANMIRL